MPCVLPTASINRSPSHAFKKSDFVFSSLFENAFRPIRYNVFSYLGSDAPDVVSSGRSQNNIFTENTLIGSEESLKIKEADGTQFVDNIFESADTLRFDDATGNVMQGNTGLDSVTLKVAYGACFDSESDSDFTPTC